MVGREVSLRVNRPPAHPGEPVLAAENLTVPGRGARPALDNCSLTLHRGEIVGICGVEGNGQAELIEVLAGLRHPESGRVLLKGEDVTADDPNERREKGLSYIPEDRHERGLVLPFTLTENMLLGNLQTEPFTKRGVIDYGATSRITRELMQEFDVRAPSDDVPAKTLSGGNQQKLIIARELHRQPDAMLATQPTRGLDVGAIEFVHKQLVKARDEGKGVLLVSFDLDEILDLSDRILVIWEGAITGEYMSGTVSRAELGLRMGGRSGDEPAAAGHG